MDECNERQDGATCKEALGSVCFELFCDTFCEIFEEVAGHPVVWSADATSREGPYLEVYLLDILYVSGEDRLQASRSGGAGARHSMFGRVLRLASWFMVHRTFGTSLWH